MRSHSFHLAAYATAQRVMQKDKMRRVLPGGQLRSILEYALCAVMFD